jgi:hypothetical protein
VAGEGDEAPVVDAMAEEVEETKECLIAQCGENAGHFTEDCKYNKMARELKEKEEAAKSSETSNHVFHNTSREMVNNQGYSSPYVATSSNAF